MPERLRYSRNRVFAYNEIAEKIPPDAAFCVRGDLL